MKKLLLLFLLTIPSFAQLLSTPSGVLPLEDHTAQGQFYFYDQTAGHAILFQAPATVSANITFTWPGVDGTSGQALITNGGGVLSFATITGTGCAIGGLSDKQVLYDKSGACGGDNNILWDYTNQKLTITETANNSGLIMAGGSYQALYSDTDGTKFRGHLVLQNVAATLGGYIDLAPITYNPYDSGTTCLDEFGNVVQQPVELPGYTFGNNDTVMWVGTSPLMPNTPYNIGVAHNCGATISQAQTPFQGAYGLNISTYVLAPNIATWSNAFNSFQALTGGSYVRLLSVADQSFSMEQHASAPNALSNGCVMSGAPFFDTHPAGQDCYGGLAYKSGATYWYWNGAAGGSHGWNAFNFATAAGTCPDPTSPTLAIQYNNSGVCKGTAAGELDANGNLTLGGGTSASSTSQLQITGTGPNAGINITASTAGNLTIQTNGGVQSSVTGLGSSALSYATQNGNFQVDGQGNISVSGCALNGSAPCDATHSGSVITIAGTTGGVNITNDTNGNSIQSVGGINLNLGGNVVGLTITEASGATNDLLDIKNHAGTKLVYVGNLGTLFANAGESISNGTANELLINVGGGQTNAVIDTTDGTNEITMGGLLVNTFDSASPGKALTVWNGLASSNLPVITMADYDNGGGSHIGHIQVCDGTNSGGYQAAGCRLWFSGTGRIASMATSNVITVPNLSVVGGRTLAGYIQLINASGTSYYVAVYN
jgi:hypothetical protein